MEAVALIAVAVFLFTYALIIDERIHRAVAAMLGAAIVVFVGIVPWEALLEHVDFGTIFLLLGMMIIVNTARGSGLFEYIAIRTAKLAKGSPIRVLVLFAIVTAIVSAFLDNVTTVLLLTPMLLYVARVMNLNPIPFLVTEIFSSNVGGAATLIGDPPNIMIASSAGLTFNEFIIHLGPIMVVDMVILLLMMYVIYGRSMRVSAEERQELIRTLEGLDERAAITDRSLFNKSVAVIAFVVFLFFIHDRIGEILHVALSFVDPAMGLEPAEVALIGAAILLFWSRQSPEEIFEKIEWPALFFFGGLFVIVGALVETGIISSIAAVMVENVGSTGEAMFIVAWFAAIASAIVDNIPLTAAMIPLIHDMGATMDVYPLWWALALGACLGGNGTAIGASANVVVIGIAEREGIGITFIDFLKVGMLVLFVTVAVGFAMLWLKFAM
ncbi:ArsB/NhaD family transporter [Methanoculleus horonobensis]|jgi:Na+/H+ antiporter NhaD/arsenite permease-like protein|uniref:SLC13 family permease n=1 Tax=Methanoculleus horonobensis TaxID=528314 RepID=UPI000834CC46|nr:ArsB/NhaD family transporter [Methanoculleus horonobensis]MDD3070441.1 ArsB/NhaD family transporter [Methanoculleus horonobensis]MDD4251773.1 ArsB/NhaD family transporter [Methanoculleus horonobensis]